MKTKHPKYVKEFQKIKELQDANNELSDILNESLKKDYGFKFGKEVESESETESSDE